MKHVRRIAILTLLLLLPPLLIAAPTDSLPTDHYAADDWLRLLVLGHSDTLALQSGPQTGISLIVQNNGTQVLSQAGGIVTINCTITYVSGQNVRWIQL